MVATLNIYETAGNSTWTKPSDSVLVEAVIASGGGGGGAGVNQPSAQGRSGGAGGGGGGVSRIYIVATDLTATVIAQVGAAGTGAARQTVGGTPGAAGGAGGDSAFYNGANLYGRSTGGVGGAGGQGGSVTAPGGVGGWGTWRGGTGGDGTQSAAGVMGGWAASVIGLGGTMVLAVGGSGGGGIDSGNATQVGGAGRWSPQSINGLAHPTNPAGGPVNGGAVGASVGVNGLTRSLYGAAAGGSGGWLAGSPTAVGNGVPKSVGGSGGGANGQNGTGSGNGGNGGPGAVYVISYPADIDVRQGSVRSSVAVTASPAGGRRATFASVSVAPLTATSLATSTARRSGSSSAPLAATSSLTHRQGSSVGQLTVIGLIRSGPLKGSTSVLVVTGTAVGSAKRTGTVRSTVAVLGRAQLVRKVLGLVRSPVAVIGTARARRYFLVTPPVSADYLDRPTKAHYHQSPTRADYLMVPTRALYDSGVGERIPWMAGQLRGSIRAQLTDANGPLPGLPSALSVRFTARRMEDGLGLVDGFATVEDAANAIVRYDPVPGDFGTPGQYGVQWLVSHSGALPQYVPDDGYDELDCMAPIVASP